MAQPPYPVIGAQDAGVQLRLEIRDLEKNSIQFSLFIRALIKIQEMRSSDESSPDYMNKADSWWQMAGIHGLPTAPWSGDPNGPQSADPNSDYGGYCYHAVSVFPTWHRVLMLLVEQAVVRKAILIAADLEKENSDAARENWVQAAKKLRFPFWDWTKRETAKEGIPSIFQKTKIQIIEPGNKKSIQVLNPLNHYRYAGEPGATQGIEYMSSWNRTYRWANNNDNPTDEQYNLALKAFSDGPDIQLFGGDVQLQSATWLREKVAALFQYPPTLSDPSYGPNLWAYFSNTSAQSSTFLPPPFSSSSAPPPSIEEPHNSVHLDTGGNGTMSVNEYASFDPIFHLHHCNVDRLYAFWEYVYPHYWMENGWKDQDGNINSFVTNGDGNFQQDPNAPINHSSPLVPFRTDTSDYWTSDNTRSLLDDNSNSTKKYYTYPAIEDPRTGVKVQVDVPYDNNNEQLREQYRQALLNEWDSEAHQTLQAVQNLSKNLHPAHRNLLLKEDKPNGAVHMRKFVVAAKLQEFAFQGSHRLELHLLPKAQHPQQQPHPQARVTVVNSASVLARTNPAVCSACKDRLAAGNQIRGYMPLDPRIVLYLINQLNEVELHGLDSLEKLSALVSESIGARLVTPDGKILAAAGPHIVVGSDEGLEEAKAPELALYSHLINFRQVAHPEAEHKATIPFVSHEAPEYHGPIGTKQGWKAY